MGDLGFGAPFNMLVSGKEHWAIKLLNDGMEPAGFQFPIWFFRVLISIPGLAAGYSKFVTFCSQQINDRIKRQGESEIQDIAHYLIDGFHKSDEKNGLLMMYADSRLIIVAGSDTTAATLTHLFYHMAGDASIVQKLREEVTPRMDDDGKFKSQQLQDAQYLNGCINEALRLNPPVPSGVYRKTPPEGIYIGETFVPGNSNVQMPGFVLGHGMIEHCHQICHVANAVDRQFKLRLSGVLHSRTLVNSSGPHPPQRRIRTLLQRSIRLHREKPRIDGDPPSDR